jgi:predicted kinase
MMRASAHIVRCVPTLFLMVGLPGAGKTTRAKELECQRPALRLSPDEWLARMCGARAAVHPSDDLRAAVEAIMWDVAEAALRLGVDVVLDFGFWSCRERDELRSRAAALGARVEVCYCDAPRDVLVARLDARRAASPDGAYHVTEQQLDQYISWFEPPDVDEL